MKLSKILMPALSIASVGAIVAPIVTSCNKGYGGIEVSEAQYNEAFAYLENIASTTDFTCSMSNTEQGKTDSYTIKVTNFKEALVSGDTSIFFKNGAAEADKKYWDGGGWQDTTFVASEIVKELVATLKVEVPYADIKDHFSNGGYVITENEDKAVIVFTKVGTNFRIKAIEASTSGKSAKIDFSNYGTTKIDNFPA